MVYTEFTDMDEAVALLHHDQPFPIQRPHTVVNQTLWLYQKSVASR
jgi:hypothetical protein